MKVSWTKGLDDQQKTDVEQSFNSATLLRRRLVEVLEEKIDSTRTVARSKSSYDTPNWPLIQSDYIGYERALYEIIDLIKE